MLQRFCNTDLSLARALQSRPCPCQCEGAQHDNGAVATCIEWHPNAEVSCTCIEEKGFSCRCPWKPPVLFSYDCNCQYSVKAKERFAANFPDLIARLDNTRFAIPVVHLRDHQDACEYIYGSYYLKGAGHFYGEQAESIWAEFNQLGARTRQMNSGHRHDIINEHIADWNWRKLTNLGRPMCLSTLIH